MISTFTPSHRSGNGSPLVLLHGFTDTWRTWDLVRPTLERAHDVFAPTLPGHAGGPALPEPLTVTTLVDALEAMLDDAGVETAHVVGNSLGGYLALRLAERGRARSVVALAPAGGWAAGDEAFLTTLGYFTALAPQLAMAAAHADRILATEAGRRQVTAFLASRYEHLSVELLTHLVQGAAQCDVATMVALAEREGWPLDAARVTCPVRFVWGNADLLLPLPGAAAGYRAQFPHAEWIELDDVGHCPHLDVPLVTAQLVLDSTRD